MGWVLLVTADGEKLSNGGHVSTQCVHTPAVSKGCGKLLDAGWFQPTNLEVIGEGLISAGGVLWLKM